jgi:glycosyltransferase involved in cell wall biosynthesis
MKLISIVIPIYNAEGSLRKCVDSVLGQTYSNYELILVNDGSTDNSAEICMSFKDNPKISVVNQQNSGVSSARNNGISKSKGDFVCFIDSDDWVEPTFLESFIDCFSNENELLVQDVSRDNSSKSYPNAGYIEKTVELSSLNELLVEFNLLRFGYPFGKFYSKSIIDSNNLKFEQDISYGEDLLFFISYLNHVEKIRFLPLLKYHYWVDDNVNSLSHRYNDYGSEVKAFVKFCEVCSKGFLGRDNSGEALHLLDAKKGLFLTRALESLYRPKTRQSFSRRIEVVKQLNTAENRRFYSAHNKMPLKKAAGYFLKKKWITTFDQFMLLIFNFRYGLGGYWPKIRSIILR